jgi:hypothetical protein
MDKPQRIPYPVAVKSNVRILLVAAAFVSLSYSEQRNRNLLGKWRSVTTSRGGIGALLNFRADGSFDYIPAAILSARYRIEGKQLISTPDNGDAEDTLTIESVASQNLRLDRAGAGAVDLKRVGPVEDPNNLILGSWVTVRTMQGLPQRAYYYFRNDGTETFTVPFRTDRCTYSITGDRIRMAVAGQRATEGQIQWEGDVLVLPWRRGEAKFKRF